MNCYPGCRATNVLRKQVFKYYKPETAKLEATLVTPDRWKIKREI